MIDRIEYMKYLSDNDDTDLRSHASDTLEQVNTQEYRVVRSNIYLHLLLSTLRIGNYTRLLLRLQENNTPYEKHMVCYVQGICAET